MIRHLPLIVIACLIASSAFAASARTANFVVSAPTVAAAQQIADVAESSRRTLAIDWLGREMPKWSQPCAITCQVADHLGAGGATGFTFDRGEVFGWRMTVQGSLVRVLDSVIPHEVTHTIFATHFRHPIPRWADEGACTTIEHQSEKAKHNQLLIDFLRIGRGIPFNQMLAMTEYPHDVMPLYAQGYSAATFLIEAGGRRQFVEFLQESISTNSTAALKAVYGIESAAQFQKDWLAWVQAGSPSSPKEQLVSYAGGRARWFWNGRNWMQSDCANGNCETPQQPTRKPTEWPVAPSHPAVVAPSAVRPTGPQQPTAPVPSGCKCGNGGDCGCDKSRDCACDKGLAALVKTLTDKIEHFEKLEADITAHPEQYKGPKGDKGDAGLSHDLDAIKCKCKEPAPTDDSKTPVSYSLKYRKKK